MSSNILISPSILSCNFSKAGEEVKAVVEAGADLVHVDVMDGHFVDNLTIGPPVIQFLKPFSKVPLDVHLMIEKPEKWLDRYIQAGADILTFHVEACGDSVEALKHIRSQKIKSGITLRPQTPISKIEKLLPYADLALVMTVNPGFGGQSFMEDQMPKLEFLKTWAKNNNPKLMIEVDGGINSKTASVAKKAGANVLVAGNAVFKKDDYKKAIEELRGTP